MQKCNEMYTWPYLSPRQKSYANGCHKSIGRRNYYLEVPLVGHEKMPETNDRQVDTAVIVKAKRTILIQGGRCHVSTTQLMILFGFDSKAFQCFREPAGPIGWNRCDLFVLWRWWVFFLSFFAGWRCLWTKSSKRIGKDHQLAKREKAGKHGKCREHGRAALEHDVWWIVLVRMFQESSGRMDGIDSPKHSGTTSKFANSNGYSSFWFCYIIIYYSDTFCTYINNP